MEPQINDITDFDLVEGPLYYVNDALVGKVYFHQPIFEAVSDITPDRVHQYIVDVTNGSIIG